MHDLAFSPDGRTLAAACHDGKIYRWLASPNDAEPPTTDGLRSPLGDGDYSRNSPLPVPGSPLQIAVQDLESRGIPEVLVLCADAQSVKTFVLPKVGNIEAFKTYNAPLDAASFVVADLNRNGTVDMALRERKPRHWTFVGIAIMSSPSSQPCSTSENQPVFLQRAISMAIQRLTSSARYRKIRRSGCF